MLKTRLAMIAIASMVITLLAVSILPPVTGDGCLTVSYGVYKENPEKAFSSIFESRQLAQVELKDNFHQRISLFLSVYSLNPGNNLTILVPLRTLPNFVSGEPIKEDEFRERFKIDRVEKEIKKQDPDKAKENLAKGVREKMQMIGGAMIWTYPAEYTRQNIKEHYGDGKGYEEDAGTMGGGGDFGKEEPEPIQVYEFDGFSIEVYGVSAGPTLKEHLETKGLMLPNSTVFESYMGQYVAVVESKAKPPIDEALFDLILEFAPNTLDYVVERNRNNPRMSGWEREDFMYDVEDQIQQEFDNVVHKKQIEDRNYTTEVTWLDVDSAMTTFVTAIFGETNYDGEVVYIDSPLDNGKMYFPLGTSGGWPNAVGEIDVLFKVPEEKALFVQDSQDVFFDGSHWYLFHMENANPAFDLESSVMRAEEGRQDEMERAAFINDHWEELGLGINVLVIIVTWFSLGLGLKIARRKKERVFTNPGMYLFLGLSFLVSVPGALLIYFIFKPIPIKEIKDNIVPMVMLVMFPLSIIFFVLGVVL
jgi:hypothetical protein